MSNEVECYVAHESGEWRFDVIPESEYERLREDMMAMSESEYFAWLRHHPHVGESVSQEEAEDRAFEETAVTFEEALAASDGADELGEEE